LPPRGGHRDDREVLGVMTLLDDRPADADVLFKEAHQRRRRRRILLAAVLALAVGAAAAGLALTGGSDGPRQPVPSAAPVSPAVDKVGPPPRVAWVDYQGQVHIGSLQNHQQRVVASGGE